MMFEERTRSSSISVALTSLIILMGCPALAESDSLRDFETLIGPKVRLEGQWAGRTKVDKNISILILAGHADSQGIAGAGTAGAAVDLKAAAPMDSSISDELFWNLKVCDELLKRGRARGLRISSYIPKNRNINDENNPLTNWSVGAQHAQKGWYVFEIHFDSYGDYGFGSGLIPALSMDLNTIDESFAKIFGRYPLFFRGGLGAPRRGIRLLEIGKLDGKLEKSLREESTRQKTIESIADKIIESLEIGIRGNLAVN